MNRYPLARYVAQFFVIGLPLLTGSFSLFDFLGYVPDAHGTITVSLLGLKYSAPKVAVEFQTRAIVSGVLLGLALLNEYNSAGLPLKRMREFRRRYLDDVYASTISNLVGEGFRINLMYMRWPGRVLFLPCFEWAWSKNYDPPAHRDFGMRIFYWQGVAGMAYRSQIAKSAYFTEGTVPRPWRGPYRLFGYQLRRTAAIKGLLSVPVLRKDASGKHVAVGVINLDAMSVEAVTKLKKNEHELAKYFGELGILLGDLSL